MILLKAGIYALTGISGWIIGQHSCQIIFMKRKHCYEWWCIHKMHLSGYNCQFVHSLTSKPCFKWFLHRKFHISQLVVPIRVLFIPSPPEFDRLYGDIKISVVRWFYRKLLKKLQPQTQHNIIYVANDAEEETKRNTNRITVMQSYML